MPNLHYQYLSPVIDNLFGPDSLQAHLKKPDILFDLVHPDDYEILKKKMLGTIDFSQPIMIRVKNHLGEYIWFEEYATPIYENGQLIAVQGIYRNIHDKVKLQQQLEYKATHDALTNLYNRAYFEAQSAFYNATTDLPIALVICDLDNLKYVNDYYGHKAGDEFIKDAAAIFSKVVQHQEFVARIGGDEFAFMLPGANEARIQQVFAQIEQSLQRANSTQEAYKIELSKGYAFHTSSYHQMERLYIEADNKMYEEKKTKTRYRAGGDVQATLV